MGKFVFFLTCWAGTSHDRRLRRGAQQLYGSALSENDDSPGMVDLARAGTFHRNELYKIRSTLRSCSALLLGLEPAGGWQSACSGCGHGLVVGSRCCSLTRLRRALHRRSNRPISENGNKQELLVKLSRTGTPLATIGAEPLAEEFLDRPSDLHAHRRVASCLFISSLWPEPSSSAAGVRTEGLLHAFQDWGYNVSYAASANPNHHAELLRAAGIGVYVCEPNKEKLFTHVLAETQPDVVVFDRFFAEEAFSFRVRQLAPDALRILDMQDLHALRRSRQTKFKTGAGLSDVLSHTPSANNDDLLRELAAIHRSDLTLVCSPVEMRLLQNTYGISPQKLALASFFCEEAVNDLGRKKREATGALKGPGFAYGPGHGYEERSGFVTIGGFRHPPNVDAVKWLGTEVWPRLRAALPAHERETAVMRVYGAYPTPEVNRLHSPEEGFLVCGYAKSLRVLAEARVLLAPLQYGAGIKGKIVDAWRYGLPVVTTPIGAEGMHAGDASISEQRSHGAEDSSDWGGLIASSTDEFAADAAKLYSDRATWEAAQSRGRELLRILYSRDTNLGFVRQAVDEARASLEERRAQDFVGALLWHQSARSTEYFSRWIEAKAVATGGSHRPMGSQEK